MKRIFLSVVLTISMVASISLPMVTEAYGAVQVTDIAGHRSEAAIKEAMELGVIKGYPDGTYRPDGLINREEFFSIINNVLTVKPSTANTVLDFIDVDPIEWYIPIVKTMVEAKITNGIGWDKVGIGLKITQEEAIKILATIIPTKELPVEPIAILATDKGSISSWAEPYYQIMMKKGYVKNTVSALNPKTELTREFAAILLLKIKKGETVIAGNANEIMAEEPAAILPEGTITGGCITTFSHHATEGGFFLGKGTELEPYQVSTQDQLNHVREHSTQGAFFVMTKDIAITKDFETILKDFNSMETDWSYGNFQPLGTKEIPFRGNFNGAGYKIEGLNILGTVLEVGGVEVRELASYVGLFGAIGEASQISNLEIANSRISGKAYTGAIAGYSEGILRFIGIGEGTLVKGASFTGGIAGYNGQLMEKCYSKGSLTGGIATGALVGKNYGILRYSYWLVDSFPEAVGVSGMSGSIQEVKQLTSQEFVDQKVENLIEPK